LLLVNGDFSAGNTGFTSGYALVPNGTLTEPGDYGVVTNPATAFTNGYASFGDHTTGSGLMMFGDGTSGNVPFWSETVNVAPNTAYVFIGWATAADSPNPAVLQLSANGAAIGGDFPINGTTPGLWQEFSWSLNTGSETSLTLTISDVNPTPFVLGNDFAIDDLSFAASVPEPSSLLLGIIASVACGSLYWRRPRGRGAGRRR
jgi:hypothetical protein